MNKLRHCGSCRHLGKPIDPHYQLREGKQVKVYPCLCTPEWIEVIFQVLAYAWVQIDDGMHCKMWEEE